MSLASKSASISTGPISGLILAVKYPTLVDRVIQSSIAITGMPMYKFDQNGPTKERCKTYLEVNGVVKLVNEKNLEEASKWYQAFVFTGKKEVDKEILKTHSQELFFVHQYCRSHLCVI